MGYIFVDYPCPGQRRQILEEAERLVSGLKRVREEIRSDAWKPEDVHLAVEAQLTELVGEVGKKLHTARWRNDQVATDVRLWLKRRLAEMDDALADLIDALADASKPAVRP